MKTFPSSRIAPAALVAVLLAFLLPLPIARGAENAALQAEIDAFRKTALEKYKDRKPDNFEDYVRDTASRAFYQRQFNAALVAGDVPALEQVMRDFPEFGRPQFLNGGVIQGKPALLYAVEQGQRGVVEMLLARKVGADAPPAPRAANSPFMYGSFGPPPPGWIERRDTPLHAAVRGSNMDLARLLLQAGANVEAPSARGETPLAISVLLLTGGGYPPNPLPAGSVARERQNELLTLLLKQGAKLFFTDRFEPSSAPLSSVLSMRHEEVLDRLLTHCVHLAATNFAGATLVHIAVSNGRLGALKTLLAKEAPATTTNAAHFTPLQTAAWLPPIADLPAPRENYGTVPAIAFATRAGFVRQQSADLLLAAGVPADAVSLAGLGRTNELTALLRRDATLVNATDAVGRAPLHYAIHSGDARVVNLLLQAGAKLELEDKGGQTPLLAAILRGDAKFVDLLLQAGAKAEMRSNHGQTPLFLALANQRSLEARALLAAGARAAGTNSAGQSALHVAVGFGDTNLFTALHRAGAELNVRDGEKRTAVERAAAARRFDLVNWLRDHGAEIPAKAVRLMATAFHQTVSSGNFAAVQKLLADGVEVNARDELGRTPLRLAVDLGRGDLIHLLLTNGANANIVDTNGISPLHVRYFLADDPVPDPVPEPGFSKRPPASVTRRTTATRAGTLPSELRPAVLGGQPPLNNPLLLLLEAGADPRPPDRQGNNIFHALRPPLNEATRQPAPLSLAHAVARIRLLVNYGLPPDTRATNGLTPLQVTVARADLVHTFALLEAGADVNATDARGRTALHHVLTPQMNPARWQNEPETRRLLTHTLALLLDNGADLRRGDTNGNTPLHLLPALDAALRDLLLPVLKTNANFAPALELKNHAGQTPVVAAFEQLRANPTPPIASLIAAFIEASGEIPAVTRVENPTLLHELAGIPIVGHPRFGRIEPDPAATETLTKLVEQIVSFATRVDSPNTNGETPLHVAARLHNTAFAAALLARGANPNARDQQGDTPLHLALRAVGAGHQRYPVIPLLVSNRCDLGARNFAGETPLRLENFRQSYYGPLFLPPGATNGLLAAAAAGDWPSVAAHLKIDPSLAWFTHPTNRTSALRAAALAGQTAIAERLRQSGATDPVGAAVLGWTNLLAAAVAENPRLGETNLGFGMPLLHLAASRGQLAAAKILLTESVSPRIEDHAGRTALYHASTNGNAGLVSWLVERGAQWSLFDCLALADTKRLKTLLNADPARANATNNQAIPALLAATDLGNVDIVRQLLAHGADPNRAYMASSRFFLSRFIGGTTPLHLAAWSNRLDLAEALVSAKASVAAANDRGYAPLHLAATIGAREMAEWLLAHGADPNLQIVITNKSRMIRMIPPMNPYPVTFGFSPLHLAVRHAHPALIELLVAKGAKLDVTDVQGRTLADLATGFSDPLSSPSPYGFQIPRPPSVDANRDPARIQATVDMLKKLGVVIPGTRGAFFGNRSGLPPFSPPPPPPTPPPGVPPTQKQ